MSDRLSAIEKKSLTLWYGREYWWGGAFATWRGSGKASVKSWHSSREIKDSHPFQELPLSSWTREFWIKGIVHVKACGGKEREQRGLCGCSRTGRGRMAGASGEAGVLELGQCALLARGRIWLVVLGDRAP